MNTQTKQKKFIIKERSLSSLPSRNFSVSDFMGQKQSQLSSLKTMEILKKSQIMTKNKQISQLQQRLKGALNFAFSQRLTNSKKKQDAFFDQKMRKWFEYKIKELQGIILKQRQKNHQLIIQIQDSKKLMQIAYEQKDKLTIQRQERQVEIKRLSSNFKKIQKLQAQLKDIGPLKQRIMTLQLTLRQQRLKVKSDKKQFYQVQKQNQKLLIQLSKQKPFQQQLKQNIAYLQRVNLDLTRKMQDFNRRQNQYIKNANTQRNLLTKTINQRNSLQAQLQKTQQNLQNKIQRVHFLQSQVKNKNQQIVFLKNNLQRECKTTIDLTKELQQTIAFYESQALENQDLKKRNTILQTHEVQLRRTINSYQKVNDQVNLTIISRSQQIQKLSGLLDLHRKMLDTLQQKFYKFETVFQQKTQKGQNQIKQFFYKHIRQNNKLNLTVKQMRFQIDQRILLFGQQRDNLVKQSQVRSIPIPDNNNLYEVVYEQKKQELILLEGSNDQLLKIKKDLQTRLARAQQKLQQQKKQTITLKLKAADVFRAKKEVEDARKASQRYQQMIQQLKLANVDLQSQLKVLREKIIGLSDKNFQLQLQNKNNSVQIFKQQQIIEQLNARKLDVVKKVNQKKGHLISDSILKLQNGIKSLSFFFTCCFCHESTTSSLVTLANCGHNFCQKPKCKQAYSQYCYECDSGMPIQSIFTNKYLKEAAGKYKFLQMVIQEAMANLKTINQESQQQNLNKEQIS